MTVMTPELSGHQAARDAFVEGPGAQAPAWLADLRQAGWDRFQELGFPTTDHEDWRIADVSPIAKTAFTLPKSQTAGADIGTFDDLSGPTLAFVDGAFAPELSNIGSLPKGVLVMPLSEAIVSHRELVEPRLASLAGDGEAFTEMNTAFLREGLFVHVAKNVDLPGAVQARFLARASSDACMTQMRSLVVLEEGARATVLEEFLSEDEAGPMFTNAVTQYFLGANAHGKHYLIEREHEAAYVVSSLYVEQQRDTDFASHSALLGGAVVRNNVFPTMRGENCMSVVNGMYIPHDDQIHDNRMLVRHTMPNCQSRQYYRGILSDHAKTMFSGRIVVDEGAQQTDAVQSNKNLLLSRTCMAQTKPQLEIYADDVKCTHGATTGQIDESAIFYFKARGIHEADARRLLTFAFVNEIFERMDLEVVRERLQGLVADRLNQKV
ncbi:MAG: Fe-S cluster assembly protein SufD [Gemmatimonadota bacterium]|nr:MAG: Fe-S cluster assembly protein SufD [Gemmatimonadota bacterium]